MVYKFDLIDVTSSGFGSNRSVSAKVVCPRAGCEPGYMLFNLPASQRVSTSLGNVSSTAGSVRTLLILLPPYDLYTSNGAEKYTSSVELVKVQLKACLPTYLSMYLLMWLLLLSPEVIALVMKHRSRHSTTHCGYWDVTFTSVALQAPRTLTQCHLRNMQV